MTEALIPIHKIVELSKKHSIDWGKGNPQNRLRYYAKHSLIPQAKRKLPTGSSNPKATIAHYPASTVTTLINIQRLKRQGYSIRKIKYLLEKEIFDSETSPLAIETSLLGTLAFRTVSKIFPILLFLSVTLPTTRSPDNIGMVFLILAEILIKSLLLPFPFLYSLLITK